MRRIEINVPLGITAIIVAGACAATSLFYLRDLCLYATCILVISLIASICIAAPYYSKGSGLKRFAVVVILTEWTQIDSYLITTLFHIVAPNEAAAIEEAQRKAQEEHPSFNSVKVLALELKEELTCNSERNQS